MRYLPGGQPGAVAPPVLCATLLLVSTLTAAGCGPSAPQLAGYWEGPGMDPTHSMMVAVGWTGDHRIFDMSNYLFKAGGLETSTSCTSSWKMSGGRLIYSGTVTSLHGAGALAADTADLQNGAVTLSWTMGDTFNQYATQGYQSTHPSADPNLSLKVTATLKGQLSAKILALEGTNTYTDATTGKVVATDHWTGLKLGRVQSCPFGP